MNILQPNNFSGYHLFGIGAAILDIEASVSSQFLVENSLEKGSMCIVSNDQQVSIINRLENNSKLHRNSGGSVCNSIVASSQLGLRTYFCGKVANDLDGDTFISDLKQFNVTSSETRDMLGQTGTCLVLVSEDGERTMMTNLGSSSSVTESDLDVDALKKSKWLFTEGYLLAGETTRQLVKKALTVAQTEGVRRAITLSDVSIVRDYREDLLDILSRPAEIIFCNKNEVMEFMKSKCLDDACRDLKKFCKAFAVTNGAEGAIIYNGTEMKRVPGFKARSLDSTGAGDVFAGSFLAAISHGNDYFEAGLIANHCAAAVVSQFGARLKTELIAEKFKV